MSRTGEVVREAEDLLEIDEALLNGAAQRGRIE